MIQPSQWLRNAKTSTSAVALSFVLCAGIAGCRSAGDVNHQPTSAPATDSLLPVPDPLVVAAPGLDEFDDALGSVFVGPVPPNDGDAEYDEIPNTSSPTTTNARPSIGTSNGSLNDEPIEPLIAESEVGSNDKSTASDESDVDSKASTLEKSERTTNANIAGSTPAQSELAESLRTVDGGSPADRDAAPLERIDSAIASDLVAAPMPEIKPSSTEDAAAPKAIESRPLFGQYTNSDNDEVGRSNSEPVSNKSTTNQLFPTQPKGESTVEPTGKRDAVPALTIDDFDSASETKESAGETQVVPSVPLLELPELDFSKPTTQPAPTTDAEAAVSESGRDRTVARAEIDVTDRTSAESNVSRKLIPELVATIDGEVHRLAIAKDGRIFVSHATGISVIGLDGAVSQFSTHGATKGLIVFDGGAVICDAEQRAIIRLNESGSMARSLGSKSDGYFLRSPNSIVADGSGGFYFSDPGYARIRNAIGKVHYIDAKGEVTLAVRKLAFPEGVALTRDGSTLLVAEGQENIIAAFQILSPGVVGPKRVFCKLPQKDANDLDDFVTGLCVAANGEVYVAHHGMQQVEVISSEGEWQSSINLPGTTVIDVAVAEGVDDPALIVIGQRQNHHKGQIWRVSFDNEND